MTKIAAIFFSLFFGIIATTHAVDLQYNQTTYDSTNEDYKHLYLKATQSTLFGFPLGSPIENIIAKLEEPDWSSDDGHYLCYFDICEFPITMMRIEENKLKYFAYTYITPQKKPTKKDLVPIFGKGKTDTEYLRTFKTLIYSDNTLAKKVTFGWLDSCVIGRGFTGMLIGDMPQNEKTAGFLAHQEALKAYAKAHS